MDEEIIETPAEEAPEPEPFTLPEDFASQVQGWDVPIDALPAAVEQYKALQTEEGVIDAFIATGQSLGFGLKELNRLFDEEAPAPVAPAAPAAPAEPEDPDRLMTAAEVQAMLAEVRGEQEQFQQALTQKEHQARQEQVFGAMNQWFDSQDVKDEQTRRQIATFGEKHVLPTQDSYDPRVAIAALERGKAEYDAWVEAEAQNYLKRKQAAAKGQPTPVGGGSGGTSGGDGGGEQVDYQKLGGAALDTAKERVRARLRASDELG